MYELHFKNLIAYVILLSIIYLCLIIAFPDVDSLGLGWVIGFLGLITWYGVSILVEYKFIEDPDPEHQSEPGKSKLSELLGKD